MKTKRIGILMGGKSAEREISLKTGVPIARALRKKGYDVVEIDAAANVDATIRETEIEAAFIALHCSGAIGDDGHTIHRLQCALLFRGNGQVGLR